MLEDWLLKRDSYRVLTILVIFTIISICTGATLFINQVL